MMKRTPEASRNPQRYRVEATRTWLNLSHSEFDSDLYKANQIGHKAASLQKLMRAGFNVPNAFCIPTPVFDQVVQDAIPGCETLAELRDALDTVEIPEELIAKVQLHCADGVWAIRSSSTLEDGPTLSFAGQADSVLNVTGPADVERAIRTVWKSAFSERSLTYRVRARLDASWAKMAVIVQRMVFADVGGVLFTVNPTDANDEAMVVCAAPGPQPDVVGGADCDTYYIARGSGYVIKQETPYRSLTVDRLKDLARVGERMERLFGSASDVEWGIVDDRITILQSRPVTRLESKQTSVWSNANVGESLPGVATPLTWSVIEAFSERGFRRAFGAIGLDVPVDVTLADSFYGRIFLNLTEFVRVARGIPFLTPQMLFEMAGGGGVDKVTVDEVPNYLPFLRRLPKTVATIVGSQFTSIPAAKTWNAIALRTTEAFFDRDLSRLRHDELTAEKRRLDSHFNRTGEMLLSVSSNLMLCIALSSEVLDAAGLKERFPSPTDLLDGLHVSSAEAGIELLELARTARRSIVLRRMFEQVPASELLSALRARSNDPAVCEFLKQYDQFISTFGRRSVREAELATPRWREQPSFVFEVLKGHVAMPYLAPPNEMSARRRERRAQLKTELESSFTFGAQKAFGALMTWARVNAQWRETIRARVVDALDMYRSFYLECGRRLVRQGALRRADDVFFLTQPEVERWLDSPTISQNFRLAVLTRRAQFDAYSAVASPPSTFVFDGQRIVSAQDADLQISDRLSGLAAGPGVASGRARVVTKLEDVSGIEPGDVLVIPFADIGFTPMFLHAAAIVIELGGPLSHAAIVAREYGIPTIVNVARATELVEDGSVITVNGDEGWVGLSLPEQ